MFYLKDGYAFERDGDKVRCFKDERLLFETDLNGIASLVATFSPWQEQNGSFDYVYQFLKDGAMRCAGCGCKLLPGSYAGGCLSIINSPTCKTCYEEKFKPLFDYALERRPK